MAPDFDLLKFVPAGEADAVGYREIHRRLGMWSPLTVRNRLNSLVAAGAIKKKTGRWKGPWGEISLYYAPPVS